MTERLPDLRPGEELDYEIDASGLLDSETSETLVEGQSSITVTGATKASQTFTDGKVRFWLSGATQGVPVYVDARLRTSGGRTFARLYVIPFGEPVSVEQAKAHLNIEADWTDDDVLIADYVTAAREMVEELSGDVILVRRDITEHKDGFGDYLTLYKRPIPADATVTIAYVDATEEEQDYAGAVLRLGREPARIYPASGGQWPEISPHGGVTVTYPAGYAEGQVPRRYIQAILLLTAHFYRNRTPVSIAANLPQELQFAVTSLINKQPVL